MKWHPYIVMELMKNGTLRDILDEGNCRQEQKVPEPALSQITCQILLLLNYMKKKNIAHRDLKPANVFYTKKGIIKGNKDNFFVNFEEYLIFFSFQLL